jgi:inner membrane protein
MAAARYSQRDRVPRASSFVLWSVLSLVPDADVVGFALGVRYGDQWGHRGATHSLLFSVVLGVAIGVVSVRSKLSHVRVALVATAVLVSHALLDTMTDGGLGCALLWPFDLTRYFAPWRPIPVAPIGLRFLSPSGVIISLGEVVLFAPALVFALRSKRLSIAYAGVLLAVWLAALTAWWTPATRDAVMKLVS